MKFYNNHKDVFNVDAVSQQVAKRADSLSQKSATAIPLNILKIGEAFLLNFPIQKYYFLKKIKNDDLLLALAIYSKFQIGIPTYFSDKTVFCLS